MKKIWGRVGMLLEVTDEEYEKLLGKAGTYIDGSGEIKNNELIMDYELSEKFLKNGVLDGESYIPEDCLTLDFGSDKPRIFVDMDGTINEWEYAGYDEIYFKDFFASRKPIENVINVVKELIKTGEYDVYILSACLMDSKYARSEKEAWLNEYLPEIPKEKYIFTPCGEIENKAEYIPGGIKDTDILIDDYSKNLLAWENAGGKGLKLLNGINSTRGEWLTATMLLGVRWVEKDEPFSVFKERIDNILTKTIPKELTEPIWANQLPENVQEKIRFVLRQDGFSEHEIEEIMSNKIKDLDLPNEDPPLDIYKIIEECKQQEKEIEDKGDSPSDDEEYEVEK